MDDIYDSLHWDEKMVSDMLGVSYSAPGNKTKNNEEDKLRDKLREHNLIKSIVKKEIDQNLRQQEVPRKFTIPTTQMAIDTFQAKPKNDLDDLFTIDTKTLTYFLIILVIFCVVQYFIYCSMLTTITEKMKQPYIAGMPVMLPATSAPTVAPVVTSSP